MKYPAGSQAEANTLITINCRCRGRDSLCSTGSSANLLTSISVYEKVHKWFVYLMMVMPDHVHLIASFNHHSGIKTVVTPWKSYHAKLCGIDWQSGFFEHRLRNDDEFTEKYHYVLLNPVRGGLVERWQEWPHKFVRGKWEN